MSSSVHYPVTCPCGHKGEIHMRENDAPFSRQWEEYSLSDLKGEGFYINGVAQWEQVFAETKAQCPKCGLMLGPEHMD